MEGDSAFLNKIGNAAGMHSTNFSAFFGKMERDQIVFLAAFPQISYNFGLKNYTKLFCIHFCIQLCKKIGRFNFFQNFFYQYFFIFSKTNF